MHQRAATLVALSTLALAACQDPVASPPSSPDRPSAAVAGGGGGARAIPGEYIVVFKDAVGDSHGLAARLAAKHGGTVRFSYGRAIKGFAGHLPDAAVAALRADPAVAYVEPDAEAQLFTTQSGATWGLDRIDQADLPLSGTYSYTRTGAGVTTYILDTGINLNHAEFTTGGVRRASYIPNGRSGDFVGDRQGTRYGAKDCHGHGTHVAGTVGGNTWGVAKGASIVAGRVVDCRGSGNVSMAIAGVDWITANAQKPAVVNMSLGYGNVQSLRDAVERSVTAGVSYAVAAGNGDAFGRPLNACNESPAGAPNVVTVGATSSTDREASFSNFGPCVDILAPGVSITSANYKNTTGSATMSGTSMASPHVAGVIALYLQGNPAASPAQVTTAIKAAAVTGTLTLNSATNGTPNLMLFTSY